VSEPPEITALSGQKIPRRMSIEVISFAAHVDYTHNSQFIEMIDANHIVRDLLAFILILDPGSRGKKSNGSIKKRVNE
jgi:Cft2 family RNA processing exonuclease